MKKLNILLIALVSLTLFSCEDDDHVTISQEIVPPVLQELTPENFVITEEMNIYDKIAYWHWQAPDYGFPASVNYTVQADISADFPNPFDIGSIEATSIAITGDMLNKAGLNYTSSATPITLFVRLKAEIATDEFGAYAPEVYSNTQLITFTPFPLYPTNLYMIGADFGNWDWGSDGVVTMIPVNGLDGTFWCIRYLQAGKGFKWAPQKAWDGAISELSNKSGYDFDGDGNAVIANDGLYMIYVDYLGSRIIIEEAKVYGMGDCFGGWDAEKHLFTNNGRLTSITTSNTGELRMYAGTPTGVSGPDWWTREFIILNGVINYRGNGGDQDRVTVPAGRTVTLDFNASTGSY